MKNIKPVMVILILSVILSFKFGYTEESGTEDLQRMFDSGKEAKIDEIMGLPANEAFKQLKSTDFIIDVDYLNKAILKTFGQRKMEGINLAMYYISLPQKEIKNGKLIDRTDEHFIAKNILNLFPELSINKLLQLYKNSDPIVKGNIIRASGKIDKKDIEKLLVSALNDKTFCETSNPEIIGFPLRVCDEAYNQLILRYGFKDVLRVIGNDLTIEDRDYHINILKNKLNIK